MGHIIVIGDVDVFNVQWFLYNTSLPTFLKFQQRQRIFINFRQQLKASINTDKRHFKIQTSDMGSPQAGLLTVTDVLTACVVVTFRVKES